ncbi:acyltransferase [Undibacterium sp. TS12]|nr:acyltransferase [Undibacterium sp. TS12]
MLLSHWLGVYWGMRELVAAYTASPVQTGPNPMAYQLVSINPEFGLGPLGVSIFFLISGFVIPFSLEKNSRSSFMLARVFRIFPTYWTGMLVSLGAVWLSGLYWGNRPNWDVKTVVANAFLCHDLLGIPTTDLVNWTLAIELKFYIVIALLSAFIREGKILALFALSAFFLLFNCLLDRLTPGSSPAALLIILQALATASVYIQFMLIGIFFYHASRGRLSTVRLAVCVLTQLFLFALTWKYSPINGQFPVVPKIYGWGLLIFTLAYLLQHKFHPNRAIDWLADISFPLYAIHGLTGYVLIKLLLQTGMSFNFAALLSFALVSALAFLLHRTTELPSLVIGKRLAQTLMRRKNLNE